MSRCLRPRVAASLVLAALVLPLRPVVAADRTASPRVLSGQPVEGGHATYVASLQKVSGDGAPAHFCGGSLIDPEWILTAAHCVDGVTPEEFRVVIGARRLSTGGAVHRPAEVRVHPEFNGDVRHGADIALVRLTAPVADIRLVEPVRPGDRNDWNPGAPAYVLGWGVTNATGTEPSDALMKAIVAIQADADMVSAYGDRFLPSDMLGAGRSLGGFDACRGDSGGPLVINSGRRGVRQVGIVSFGQGCGDPEYPGVYSRLGEGRVRAFADSFIPLRVAPLEEREGHLARFALKLARPSTVASSVSWETVGETAKEGVDFVGGRGVIQFTPGQTNAVIDVEVRADRPVEADETFRLKFSKPANLWLASESVSGTILDRS